MSPYPATAAARDRFVLERRPSRPRHDPWHPQGVSVEDERDADGSPARVATLFLTGRECPWRCVMCDLWRYTIEEDTPPGAIPAQIAAARRVAQMQGQVETHAQAQIQPHVQTPGRAPAQVQGGAIAQMKLYNAGSFFDPRAVPEGDYEEVAARLAGLTRVIVESHPALVGPRVDRFRALLEARLEVAMGLETAHPDALERLHKRITLDGFARAAAALRQCDVDVRVFLLIAPPFVPPDVQDEWLLRSVDAAFSCGASVVSLVPTRPGNGALDALAADGLFRAPTIAQIERRGAAAIAHAAGRGRVFVDLWDLDRFSDCPRCLAARRARLHGMNLTQRVPQDVPLGVLHGAPEGVPQGMPLEMPQRIPQEIPLRASVRARAAGSSTTTAGWSTCAGCGDRVPS